MSTAIAYWLIPSEPTRGFFEKLIVYLARRYDAPVFEPHVTIHVGPDRAEAAAEQIVSQAAIGCEPIRLEVLDVHHSGEFTKTLSVQLALNANLQRLSKLIRGASQTPSDYQLEPHVSLVYRRMSLAARRELARSIRLPFSTVVFDSIKAVCCASPTRNRAEVEAWRVIATKSLSR
jgi:2'-5' RNA ligase